MEIILQKIIANSGFASRRKAEELIRGGHVKINGQLAFIGEGANPKKDIITIDDRPLPRPEEKIYIKLNKPRGYVCTNRKFSGEKNIFDLISLPQRLFAVGRLDKDSRGLILLTNDGEMTQRLTHPKFQHEKVYEVKVRGELTNINAIINKLLKGVDIGEGDGVVRAKKAKYLQNQIFIITLSEGKKRQIRRMFKAIGLNVADLKRTSIAGLEIHDLKEGYWINLTKDEILKLQE